jgi:hypothetical protein
MLDSSYQPAISANKTQKSAKLSALQTTEASLTYAVTNAGV